MSAALKPDAAVIRDHLEFLTRDWSKLGADVRLELRALNEGGRSECEDFDPSDPSDLDAAVQWAVKKNASGSNVYVLINPKKADAEGRAAKNTDIAAALFHVADADDEVAAAALAEVPCSAVVVTGTKPNRRKHLYWQLGEPVLDLDQWTYCQKAIAKRFGSDRSVVNPARIMRLAGTVTWPNARKRQRGYVPELTGLESGEDRGFSAADIVGEAFLDDFNKQAARESQAGAADSDRPRETSRRLLDLLARKRNMLDDRDDWMKLGFGLKSGYTGTKWEDDARAAFVEFSLRWDGSNGRSDDELRREAEKLWDSAKPDGRVTVRTAQMLVDKMPELGSELLNDGSGENALEAAGRASPDPDGDENGALRVAPFGSTPLKDIEPTPWLYGHHHQRGAVTVTAAPGGTGKSLLAIVEALAMASGRSLLGAKVYGPLRVMLISGEEDELTLRKRVSAAMQKLGLADPDLDGRLIIVDAARLHELFDGSPRLVVQDRDSAKVDEKNVETLRRLIADNQIDVLMLDPLKKFHAVDENDNGAMDLLADALRQLAEAKDIGIEAVHHSNKDARRPGHGDSAAAVRGASAIVDAARSVRTLSPMSESDSKRYKLEDPAGHIRVTYVKSNNAKMGGSGHWFRIESVALGNGNSLYPDGDSVGVAVKWTPPAEDGTEELALQGSLVLKFEGFEGNRRKSDQSDESVGHEIATALGLDVGRGLRSMRERTEEQNGNRSEVRKLIAFLVNHGALVGTEVKSNGRTCDAYRVDPEQLEKLKREFGP